jgi:hypothetical protein
MGERHRYPCTYIVTHVHFLVRLIHSNHYPYSEPASREVFLYCLALYDGVSIRLLRRLVHGYQVAFASLISVSIAGFKVPHYEQREARGAKERHRGAYHVGDKSSLKGTAQRHLG